MSRALFQNRDGAAEAGRPALSPRAFILGSCAIFWGVVILVAARLFI